MASQHDAAQADGVGHPSCRQRNHGYVLVRQARALVPLVPASEAAAALQQLLARLPGEQQPIRSHNQVGSPSLATVPVDDSPANSCSVEPREAPPCLPACGGSQ